MAPVAPLVRVKPEEVGIASKGILDFIDLVQEKQIMLHSFVLLRHGKVAAEGTYAPYESSRLHPIFSVSKSFTSAAVGIAIAEGRFGLHDRVVDLLPAKATGEIHPYIAAMTVEHLLKMTTAHRKSTPTDIDDWVHGFLHTEPTHPPGTMYAYDTTGTHTLCAIIQETTGMTVHEYLRPRLFDAIGMGQVEWDSCPLGINKGGSGLKTTTDDLARFGQLYLNDGVWDGVRLLPEGWVEQSTRRQVDNSSAKVMLDGKPGYGYQFWRVRKNAYCAFGMAGQFVVVIPDKDAVFVTTANTQFVRDGQQMIMDCLWEALYPAMLDEEAAVDEAEQDQLAGRLSSLKLALPVGSPAAAIAEHVSGRCYQLTGNPFGFAACRFRFAGEQSALTFTRAKDSSQAAVPFGMEQWVTSERDQLLMGIPCGGAATWTDEHTCVIHVHLLDLAQMYMLICHFTGDTAVIKLVTAGTELKEDVECYLIGSLV